MPRLPPMLSASICFPVFIFLMWGTRPCLLSSTWVSWGLWGFYVTGQMTRHSCLLPGELVLLFLDLFWERTGSVSDTANNSSLLIKKCTLSPFLWSDAPLVLHDCPGTGLIWSSLSLGFSPLFQGQSLTLDPMRKTMKGSGTRDISLLAKERRCELLLNPRDRGMMPWEGYADGPRKLLRGKLRVLAFKSFRPLAGKLHSFWVKADLLEIWDDDIKRLHHSDAEGAMASDSGKQDTVSCMEQQEQH